MVDATVIVDNKVFYEGLKQFHGLSIYVEAYDFMVLFDTGPKEEVLQFNSEKLGINLDLLDAAIISHIHSDHVGGIPYLGWSSPYLKVYIPFDSLSTIGRKVKANGLVPIEVLDWIEIKPRIHVSKPFYGPPWEHFLVVDADKGLILFSGCMHPRIDNVLREITQRFRKKIYAIMGGFHLENAPLKIIEEYIDKLVNIYGIEKIIPLHCSGEYFRMLLKKKYPERYVDAGAGSCIYL